MRPEVHPRRAAVAAEDPKPQEESKQQESEVPLAVAETEQAEGSLAEVVVQARIRNLRARVNTGPSAGGRVVLKTIVVVPKLVNIVVG